MKFDDVVNARFAETGMPAFITTCETAAVNAFLRSEWVLIFDKRVEPNVVFAFPSDMSANVLYRTPKE